MIREVRAEFASKIQDFKKFKKLMKKKLLNTIIYIEQFVIRRTVWYTS